MKPILAPHKEQDGFVYTRMPSGIAKPDAPARFDVPRPLVCTALIAKGGEVFLEHHYDDSEPGSRIISSRRVEEAVETADFLKLCAEEGLTACFYRRPFLWEVAVWRDNSDERGTGTTLREAYYRYHAAAGDAK